MDEEMVKELAEFLRKGLMDKYGYCGVAEGDKIIMLNSGKGNILINLKWD